MSELTPAKIKQAIQSLRDYHDDGKRMFYAPQYPPHMLIAAQELFENDPDVTVVAAARGDGEQA